MHILFLSLSLIFLYFHFFLSLFVISHTRDLNLQKVKALIYVAGGSINKVLLDSLIKELLENYDIYLRVLISQSSFFDVEKLKYLFLICFSLADLFSYLT
jgi:hypothetical protein